MLLSRIRYRDAVAESLRLEMFRDPRIVFVGQDSGSAGDGGSLGATDGFAALFGDRYVGMEGTGDAVIATAAGIAAAGMRPVCELPLGQLGPQELAQLARSLEMSREEGFELPLLMLVPFGGLMSEGPANGTIDPEAWLLGIEGLRIVAPAAPEDAKGMISSALRGSEPIAMLEHEVLGDLVDAVVEGGHRVDLGRARVARRGDRVTVIAWGPAALLAERAVDELDFDVEVLDLRTLSPLDDETILASVRRTGRVVVVGAPGRESRVSADVTSLIWSSAFEYLDAPLRTVSVPVAETTELKPGGPLPDAASEIMEAVIDCLGF